MSNSLVRSLILFGLLVMFVLSISGMAIAQDEPLIAGLRVEGNDFISKEAISSEVAAVLKIGSPFTTEAREAARRTLMKLGYFDEVLISAEPADKGVTAVITVVEKKRVTKVLMVGNTVITDDQLKETIFIREGHVIDDAAIRRDVRRIEDFYTQQGYLAHVSDAQVGKFGVVTFVIEEARVEDILIEGLVRTKSVVVKREIDLKPGELFQEKRIVEQVRRIFNLGIFENVGFDPRPGVEDPERGVIVAFQIEEKRTGGASVALGYSSLDDLVLILSLQETNFRGLGERASIDLELFGRTSYEAKFYEPYVWSDGTSFSIRLFDTERRRQFVGGTSVSTANDEFDERREGMEMSLSIPKSQTTRMSVGFRSESVSSSYLQGTRSIGDGVFNPGTIGGGSGGIYYDGDEELQDGSGTFNPGDLSDTPGPGDTHGPIVVAAPLHPAGRVTSITLGQVRDTRDIRTNPTSGNYSDLSLEVAGSVLGGEVDFQKLTLERRMFRKLNSRGDVLAARAIVGQAFGDIPLFDSFSVGGTETLRGYEEDRFRGETMALLNLEYRRPISDKLTVVGFVDAGTAFGGEFPTVIPGFNIPADSQDFDLHIGTGLGLRVVTPVGPIRLDFGFGDDGSQAHFSFGHMF